MAVDVPNKILVRCQVPGDRADWDEIQRFALTFDGYRSLGKERVGELANECRESGQFSDDLAVLRGCLFFEQRRWRHYGEAPDTKGMRHIRALVRAIRRSVNAARRSDEL